MLVPRNQCIIVYYKISNVLKKKHYIALYNIDIITR